MKLHLKWILMFSLIFLILVSLPSEVYAKTSYESLVKENAKLKKETKDLKKRNENLVKENKGYRGKMKSLEGKVYEKEKHIKSLQTQVKKLQDELNKLKPVPEKKFTVKGLTYKGRASVTEIQYSKKPISNLHYYELRLKDSYPIKIYITDDYIRQYGLGFAYEEIGPMIDSIAAKRKSYPFKDLNSSLRFYFYTNASGTPFPSNAQAFANPEVNAKKGMDTAVYINGSTMHDDFRDSLHHEIVHYFDFNTDLFDEMNGRTYAKYWGPYYRFWLIEGGAEYGSRNFYSFPKNTKNNLKGYYNIKTRAEIIQYAIQQKGNRKNVLLDYKLNSFDDIYKASRNNYGVTYSLFWYLEKNYGYTQTYKYVDYIGETFKNKEITLDEKEATAKKFFGKTEEQLLKEWAAYFDYFGGELDPYLEMKTGTMNHILFKGDPLLKSFVDVSFPANPGLNFLINVKEWHESSNYEQMHEFRVRAADQFKLVAAGQNEVAVKFTGGNFSDDFLTNKERLNAFVFNITPEEQKKLKKGIPYKLVPLNDDDKEYYWIVPEDLKFIY